MSTDTADSGQQDGGSSRSRRGLLTAAAAALGVIGAETLGSAAPARAANGSPVVQGEDNTGTTRRTAVFTTGNNEWGTLADPNTSGKGSLGVYGHGQDYGVYGDTTGTGTGVSGTGGSDLGTGVAGTGGSDAGTGVYGTSGTGVIGVGTGAGAGGVAGAGGNGTSTNDGGIGVSGAGGNGNGYGVYGGGGLSDGIGVYGIGAGTGTGVYGVGGIGGGTGVYGRGVGAGSGVLAESTGAGPTLNVSGPAFFSTAGVVTVSAGKSSVTQTGVTLTSSSLIFATLQQNHSGVWVQSAVPDVAGSSFTVHLNKAVTASTTVAWFTVN